MRSSHTFEALPATDRRQTETRDREICTHCGALRSPRLGGGYVYSASGWGRSDWERTQPSCVSTTQTKQEG